MSTGFSAVDYAFNENFSLPANAALGIFSAAQYAPVGAPYGVGGDDTAAVQAAIDAATAAGGAVAFLTPPPSGSVNISATLVKPSNVWLVGASPGVTITSLASLDWMIATGTAGNVDPRTVMAVNYRSQTLGGNDYTTYDPANPIALSLNGGLMNLTLAGLSGQSTGLGHGVMLNGANGFQVFNLFGIGLLGELLSLWDCAFLTVTGIYAVSCGRAVGVHRACYDVSTVLSSAQSGADYDYVVYTEQFQVPNGPLLTLTPEYTKFVDVHRYSTTEIAAMIDLGGPAFVNMTGCTADNISGDTFYQAETRYGSVPHDILTDVGAGGVGSVLVTEPITDTGSSSIPNIGLDTPLAVAYGGTGTATPAFTEGDGIEITGDFPDYTITNSAPGAAELSELTDVEIATPTDGQVLTYVNAASKWENKAASGIGGGGAAPTIVQSAGATSTTGTSTTVALVFGSAPTVGNIMIAVLGGNGTSASRTPPSGWFQIGTWLAGPIEGTSAGGGMWVYARVVQTGDGTSYTFTASGGDRLRVVGVEIATWGSWMWNGNQYADKGATGVVFSGSYVPLTQNALCFAAFTVDTAQGAVSLPSGWTLVSYLGNDSNNHPLYVVTKTTSSYPSPVGASITWPSGTDTNMQCLGVMHAR